MADENNNAQEKTEEPTERKLKQAREDGNIVRSKEFNTMALLVGTSLILLLIGPGLADSMKKIFSMGFSFSREDIFYTEDYDDKILEICIYTLHAFIPFLISIFLLALLPPMLIGGLVFNLNAIEFKFEKLDPISGLQKIFSTKTLIELLKSVLKVGILSISAYFLFRYYFPIVFRLDSTDITQGIPSAVWILMMCFVFLSFALIPLPMIDIPYLLWEQYEKLKMTLQEVKDELKDTEGQPEVKSKLRSLQRELAKRRMITEVPKADVIITNPTHFAVAIQYVPGMTAPVLLAKGADLISEMIKKVAKAHGIPFVAAPPLARALYYNVDLEEEIPEGLYIATAKVLAYVYELKQYQQSGGSKPPIPEEFPIPDEYRRD